jgi:geranylgeranyl diphosphate synthase type I
LFIVGRLSLTVEVYRPTFPAPLRGVFGIHTPAKGVPNYRGADVTANTLGEYPPQTPGHDPSLDSSLARSARPPLSPPGAQAAGQGEFVRYAEQTRAKVENALGSWLTSKASETAKLTPEARAPIEAAFDLAKRGGKRLRAVLVAAAYDSLHGEGGADTVLLAGVSMEVLQAYLLIHDDWMDGDELRRGGPSVPAMMRARFSKPGLADASAILAGDYAAGLALDALLSVPCAPERVFKAARELARIEKDVVAGQLLDVHASASVAGESHVELTHTLKTSSYTVRGPVLIGARLAGASDDACRALEAYADPLGVAFQLRDDILGTFGEAKTTGKPALSDLRSGKQTALIAEAARDPGAQELLRVAGDADAPVAKLEALASYLVTSGARARVEARIETLLSQSRKALETPSIPEASRLLLLGAIPALAHRER